MVSERRPQNFLDRSNFIKTQIEKEKLYQESLTYSTEVPKRNDDFGGCKGYK